MFLWIALGVAVLGGLTAPFAGRLQATGLWAGKTMVPPEAAKAYPRGMQDALTDGWPSSLGMWAGMLPFIAGIVGFFHAWWFAPVSFFAAASLGAFAARLPIASPYVERYLALLLDHANRRESDYKKADDADRVEAMSGMIQALEVMLTMYMGSGVPAPNMAEAKAAPFGDPAFLIHAHSAHSGTAPDDAASDAP